MTLLKLDLDGPIPRGFFFRMVHCLRLWRWPVERIRYDRTRHGWHVVIVVRAEIVAPLIVAAQACLGSDLKRESYNLMRVQRLPRGWWRTRWNALYLTHTRKVKGAT